MKEIYLRNWIERSCGQFQTSNDCGAQKFHMMICREWNQVNKWRERFIWRDQSYVLQRSLKINVIESLLWLIIWLKDNKVWLMKNVSNKLLLTRVTDEWTPFSSLVDKGLPILNIVLNPFLNYILTINVMKIKKDKILVIGLPQWKYCILILHVSWENVRIT